MGIVARQAGRDVAGAKRQQAARNPKRERRGYVAAVKVIQVGGRLIEHLRPCPLPPQGRRGEGFYMRRRFWRCGGSVLRDDGCIIAVGVDSTRFGVE
jgi:hypothetical protein